MAGANVLLSSSRNQEIAIDAMRCKAIAGSPMHEYQPSHARCVATEALTRHGGVTIRCHDRCASS
jgi:hypothetical protein